MSEFTFTETAAALAAEAAKQKGRTARLEAKLADGARGTGVADRARALAELRQARADAGARLAREADERVAGCDGAPAEAGAVGGTRGC